MKICSDSSLGYHEAFAYQLLPSQCLSSIGNDISGHGGGLIFENRIQILIFILLMNSLHQYWLALYRTGDTPWALKLMIKTIKAPMGKWGAKEWFYSVATVPFFRPTLAHGFKFYLLPTGLQFSIFRSHLNPNSVAHPSRLRTSTWSLECRAPPSPAWVANSSTHAEIAPSQLHAFPRVSDPQLAPNFLPPLIFYFPEVTKPFHVVFSISF